MNADKIADLERKIRKGPLPSTVNTINWLFSNQEFSIKPKQYHLSILTTRPRPCPRPQWLQTVSRWRAEERGDAGGEAGHLQGGQEAAQGQAEEHRHGQHSDNGDIVTVCVQTRPPGTTAGWRGSWPPSSAVWRTSGRSQTSVRCFERTWRAARWSIFINFQLATRQAYWQRRIIYIVPAAYGLYFDPAPVIW